MQSLKPLNLSLDQMAAAKDIESSDRFCFAVARDGPCRQDVRPNPIRTDL